MSTGGIRSADDAVSSVISVILMVGVVVIVGAVVSVFALGMAENVNSTAPSASFEFRVLDNGDVEVTHASGSPMNGDNLRFAGAAHEKTTFGSITEWSGGNGVTAGDSATVNVKGGETLRLVWQSPNSDETATVAEYDVPSGVDPTASIGSINTGWQTHVTGGYVDIINIQFSRVKGDSVYVVVKDDPAGSWRSDSKTITINGDDWTADLNDNYITNGEDIIVTVYETGSKSNILLRTTVPA